MLFVLFVFKKCRRQKSEIRVLKIIREIRVQKNYYPCSKNNILRVQKKLFFVFENSKLLRRAEARGTALKLHLLFRSLALVRNSVERGHDIGIFCLAVVVGQLVEGL